MNADIVERLNIIREDLISEYKKNKNVYDAGRIQGIKEAIEIIEAMK